MGTPVDEQGQTAGGQQWPPVVQLSHISKTFGGVHALDDVDLTIERGEIHGLVGENGSGKSTLIKILAGYHAPDHDGGSLHVNGQPVKLPLRPGQFRQLGMSFVHQDLGLVPSLTVLENLRVGRLTQPGGWHISWTKEREKARRLFQQFGVDMDPMAKVGDLRPTDRARLAIVRAVEEIRVEHAEGESEWGLLILDEPTVYLPAAGKRQLYQLMREIAASHASVLFVSHDLDEVREITHRVTVLRDGKVRGTVPTAETSDQDLIRMIIGRTLDAMVVHRSEVEKRPADIAITGLSGGLLQNVDIGLHKGEVLGLTGLAGFGFEEVPYFVFGVRKPTSGVLQLNGDRYDLVGMTPQQALKTGIALVPADRQREGSVGSLTVADNVMLQVIDRYFLRMRLHRNRMMQDAAAVLEEYDVRPRDPERMYQTLSGGNQQKVLFAKWLQTRPTILFLHEPVQGVDVGARREIYRVIQQAADDGAAVVCVSSDYEVLAAVCDRVLVFGRGNRLRELVGEEISKDRIIEQCYALAA